MNRGQLLRRYLSAQPTPLLLDKFAGCVLAFSPDAWRLNMGSTIRVRELVNQNEQNFTAEQVPNIPVFTGANNGPTVTLFNQVAGGANVTQPTTTAQPLIVEAGNLVLSGGKPAVSFVGGGRALLNSSIVVAQPYTLFAVFEVKNVVGFQEIFGSSASNYMLAQNGTNLLVRTGPNGQSFSVGLQVNTRYIVSIIVNDASTTLQINNGPILSPVATPGTLGISGFNISRASTWTGLLQSVFVFAGVQSANRSAIVTELNNHYGIY